MEDPAIPVYWGKNQSGMQANEELVGHELWQAKKTWLEARDCAIKYATDLNSLGLHKQIANRILEPWMHIEVICTATEWENFYALRTDNAAQPEMKALAMAMLEAHKASVPRKLDHYAVDGNWHLPFITEAEMKHLADGSLCIENALKYSVARCARVSYLNHEGKIDVDKDIELHDKLLESGHFSPFEHQARIFQNGDCTDYCRNFYGFESYRATLPGEVRSFGGLK